ncbi:MAG: hypothetical protein WC956_03525 [bacterium]
MSVIKPKAQQTQTVGGTYGARREISKSLPTGTPPPKTAQHHRPLDNFMSTGKRPGNLGEFASNATFKAARTRFSGAADVPYKRQLHEHIENGTAPVKAINQRIPDPALLRYLKRVIETQSVNGARATRPIGKPAVPAKPAQANHPQAAPVANKPALNTAAQVRIRPTAAPARK